ncbi:DUF3703 domain-containing protein [Litorimonas haliclonae]|uniref:DUF3703 domain-containing protein n=1 Tax=Litorimonas haliclonae TaxID=2081977 RepID=UPI0039EE4138
MPPRLRHAFDRELSLSQTARQANEQNLAFHHLERAHVLGQAYFTPHLQTHWKMLAWGLRQGQLREVLGQILRLIAVFPASAFGWVPVGNTGGANVSAFQKMEISEDLQEILQDARDD